MIRSTGRSCARPARGAGPGRSALPRIAESVRDAGLLREAGPFPPRAHRGRGTRRQGVGKPPGAGARAGWGWGRV